MLLAASIFVLTAIHQARLMDPSSMCHLGRRSQMGSWGSATIWRHGDQALFGTWMQSSEEQFTSVLSTVWCPTSKVFQVGMGSISAVVEGLKWLITHRAFPSSVQKNVRKKSEAALHMPHQTERRVSLAPAPGSSSPKYLPPTRLSSGRLKPHFEQQRRGVQVPKQRDK